MKPPIRAVALLLFAMAAAGLLWLAWRPRSEDVDRLSGYVEGDALYLSAPVAGPVEKVSVAEGQRVAAGAALFALDPRQVAAQTRQRRSETAQAEEQARAAQAAHAQARANVDAARALALDARRVADRYARMKAADPGTVATQDLERAEANARASAAQLQAAEAQAANAAAQLEAARARIVQGQAATAEVDVRAEQLAPRAPSAGRIEAVFFQPGEWAAANQPVVSLLPDSRVKLRFFAPERSAALYRPGKVVRFSCDACGGERRATISYLSPRPEFTPPVIYARKARDRLVFMVEARPENPADLAPGTPVDVTPLERGR